MPSGLELFALPMGCFPVRCSGKRSVGLPALRNVFCQNRTRGFPVTWLMAVVTYILLPCFLRRQEHTTRGSR